MSFAHRVSQLTGTRPAVQTVPPTHRRVVAAGLAAAAVSLAADLMLFIGCASQGRVHRSAAQNHGQFRPFHRTDRGSCREHGAGRGRRGRSHRR